MEVTRKELCPGVWLTVIQTGQFKSDGLSAVFLAPLSAERASENALVPYVLRRGCGVYPTMAQVSARLEELYGGALEPSVRRRGETQCLGLMGSFLADPYTLDGSSNLDGAAALLTRLLLDPVTENGAFRAEYVAGEKENLIQAIRGEVNDKGSYAILRLTREMCRDERYGTDRYGREEDVGAATPQSVWNAYEALLREARLELLYCGAAAPERVEMALTDLVDGLRARGRMGGAPLQCEVVPVPRGPVRERVERMDVNQGQLTMGFRTGGVTTQSPDYPALLVCNALYGGSANSKLFLNVREKLSLCYYASSMLESLKGVLVVSSGVDFGKLDEARREILDQLEAVKAGNFTDDELAAARQTVVSAYDTVADSRGTLEFYYLGAAVSGVWEAPEDFVRRLEAVTAEDVKRVCKGITLDTVFRLVGKEEQDG